MDQKQKRQPVKVGACALNLSRPCGIRTATNGLKVRVTGGEIQRSYERFPPTKRTSQKTNRKTVTGRNGTVNVCLYNRFVVDFIILWWTLLLATAIFIATKRLTPPSPTWPDSAAYPHQCRAPAPSDRPAVAATPRAGSATTGHSVPAGGSRECLHLM
jgi:hypothetical protein